ncbi:MAG: sigma-70 family RNA polymerase sigma factor [Planctomycetes bacterium]|nr:sigma-70 family RNA polymerase sigma factor [Planctomycetota bacterium]
MSSTDAMLIRRWGQERDPEAFRELVDRHAGMVFSTSRRILRNTADAEDVTQECFLKLCQLREPARNVAAWLHRVATHGAFDVLRAHARRRAAEGRWEAPAASRDDIEWQDVEPFLDEAIEALPDDVRVPLVRYYLRNQTQEAIAESLGVNQSTVSDRVRKGVAEIRKQLQRRGLGVAPAILAGWLSTRTAEAAPAPLLARLGKVAILGLGIDRVRRTPASSGAEVAETSIMKGWAMKIAIASVAGFVLVGSIALVAFLSTKSPEPAPRDLADAPVERPSADVTAGTPAAPAEPLPSDETTPPSPAPKPAVVGGTIRDDKGGPIALADVYLAMNPPAVEDLMDSLERYLREDYFQRARFLQTKTDADGRYLFEGIRGFGEAALGAFKEGRSQAIKRLRIEGGSALTDIDLVMAEGKTLAGRVLAADGSPVTDAVVSVATAWTSTDHIFWPAGLAPTDENGRFRLGFEARATACHLRVNSDSRGQGFFVEVPVTDEAADLTLNVFARVEGRITWADGTPAAGLTVRVNGRLPEPPIPVSRMGIRSYVVHDGLVGEDGRYVIETLHPKLNYDIFVIDGSLGEKEAREKPLTPSFREFFRLAAGEVKVWDRAVAKPITIRGRIRTETTGTPLPEGQVGVRKDGKRMPLISTWADAEGFFELRLTTGPGEYRVHAEPPVGYPSNEEVEDLIDAQFGKPLRLSSGDEVEVDLTIFEPTVLPIRVLDHAGEPVKTIHSRLSVTFQNGKRMGQDGPCSLDDEGRIRFLHYYPAAEVRYEISALSGGPAVETQPYTSIPGTVFAEETITLPRTCDLTARILDPSGKPLEKRWVQVRVTYEDGSKGSFTCRTDEQGLLSEKGHVRAAGFVLEIRSSDPEAGWKSQRLDGSAGDELDLGKIVLEGEGE